MPFKPGDAKPPNSGRKKGQGDAVPRVRTEGTTTPRPKFTREVSERLEVLGLDPISGLARIGIRAEAAGELAIAKSCYAELAQYVYPKRRAVEHSGPGGGPIPISADPFESITRELSRLAERSAAGSDSTSVQ